MGSSEIGRLSRSLTSTRSCSNSRTIRCRRAKGKSAWITSWPAAISVCAGADTPSSVRPLAERPAIGQPSGTTMARCPQPAVSPRSVQPSQDHARQGGGRRRLCRARGGDACTADSRGRRTKELGFREGNSSGPDPSFQDQPNGRRGRQHQRMVADKTSASSGLPRR